MFKELYRIIFDCYRMSIRIYKIALRMEPNYFQLMTNVLSNDLEMIQNVLQ